VAVDRLVSAHTVLAIDAVLLGTFLETRLFAGGH
jgi:hypothetical protein